MNYIVRSYGMNYFEQSLTVQAICGNGGRPRGYVHCEHGNDRLLSLWRFPDTKLRGNNSNGRICTRNGFIFNSLMKYEFKFSAGVRVVKSVPPVVPPSSSDLSPK